MTKIAKIHSLKHINSAIFFPLYKVFSPMAVIVSGVLFFGERFTWFEWLGLGLGILVPLMLITKNENTRQNNLAKGIGLLLFASATAAVSASIEKYGTTITDNIWLFALLCNLFVVPISFFSMVKDTTTSLPQKLAYLKNKTFLSVAVTSGIILATSGAAFVFALALGGTLGIAYTILSLYILIPIVLSIIFYNEHWNTRKVIAIILSVVALGFFG